MNELASDLAAEAVVVYDLVTDLDNVAWDLPTPAQGWCIADQISHLAFFDDKALLALDNSSAFNLESQTIESAGGLDPDLVAERFREMSPHDLMSWFQSSRAKLVTAYRKSAADKRVPWFGPSMSAATSATARIMETWAHGRDIADALKVDYPSTDRLKHIADLGVRTRNYSYSLHGRALPSTSVRVELTAPDGLGVWHWGPSEASERIVGSAEDFCLVVTQRRHPQDTNLIMTGQDATTWMHIAQAFASMELPG